MAVTRRKVLVGGAAAVAVAGGAGLYSVSGPGASLVTPGRSRARAIETDTDLVDQVEVAVIGGGALSRAAWRPGRPVREGRDRRRGVRALDGLG